MKKIVLILALTLTLSLTIFNTICFADDWNSSPNNWNNSPSNWDNSSNKYGNDRLMRDESGNVTGYAVPKSDGGVNFYNLNGERKGYLPPR